MPTTKQSSLAQQTSIASGTAETTIVTADPSSRNNLTSLVITTLNAAVATLTVRDATTGTVKAILDYPDAASLPTAPLVINMDPPWQQTAPNNNWTIQASANVSGYKITAGYVKE